MHHDQLYCIIKKNDIKNRGSIQETVYPKRRSCHNHELPPCLSTRTATRHRQSPHHIRVSRPLFGPPTVRCRRPARMQCGAVVRPRIPGNKNRPDTHLPRSPSRRPSATEVRSQILVAAGNGDRQRHGRRAALGRHHRHHGRGAAAHARGRSRIRGGGPGRAAALLLLRVLRPVRAARRVLVLPVLLLPQVRRRRQPCGGPRPRSGLRALVRSLHVRPAPARQQDDGRVPGHLPEELRGGGVQSRVARQGDD